MGSFDGLVDWYWFVLWRTMIKTTWSSVYDENRVCEQQGINKKNSPPSSGWPAAGLCFRHRKRGNCFRHRKSFVDFSWTSFSCFCSTSGFITRPRPKNYKLTCPSSPHCCECSSLVYPFPLSLMAPRTSHMD